MRRSIMGKVSKRNYSTIEKAYQFRSFGDLLLPIWGIVLGSVGFVTFIQLVSGNYSVLGIGAALTISMVGASYWALNKIHKFPADKAGLVGIHHIFALDAAIDLPNFFLKVSPTDIDTIQISMRGLIELAEEEVSLVYSKYFERTKYEYFSGIVWTDDSQTTFNLIDVDKTYGSQFLWATFTEEDLLEFWRASRSIATGSNPSSIGGQAVIDTRGLEGDAIGRRTQSQLGPKRKSPKPRTPGKSANLFDAKFVEPKLISPQARLLARITR